MAVLTESVGSPARPLRVAVIGAGPAGFYAVDALYKQDGLSVAVDMYNRFPTPYGLVREGVAPDHPSISRPIGRLRAHAAGRPLRSHAAAGCAHARDQTCDQARGRTAL
jgi:ferredoxin--NADP+ reductase